MSAPTDEEIDTLLALCGLYRQWGPAVGMMGKFKTWHVYRGTVLLGYYKFNQRLEYYIREFT